MPNKMDIDSVINEKIDNDSDFQATLADLSDEDKEVAVRGKRDELIKTEFESLNKKAQENEQKFKDQQARAKKAEEEAKKVPPASKEEGGDLSQADVIYIAKADIHEEDIPDVTNYAKKMGVSVKEAHDFMKPILNEREDMRKTAQATQTKGGHGSPKVSPEAIIRKAEEGKISEEDTDKLAEAQMALRVARSQGK